MTSTISIIRRNRRRGVTHDQRGFALMGVLFVIAATSVVVVALMGLTMATSNLSAVTQNNDKWVRATDNALEATVNQIAHDQTGNLGYPIRINAGTGKPQTVSDCTVPGAIATEGASVTVTCEAKTSPTKALAGVDSDGWVRVVGDKYDGEVKTAWTPGGGAPWSAALGAANYTGSAQTALAAANPTFVHVGDAPLSIAGDVAVKQEGVAIRNPAIVNPTAFDSAISMTGQYQQGKAGLLDAQNPVNPVSPSYDPNDLANDCGVLQPIAHTYSAYGASIRSGEGLSCTDARASSIDANSSGLVPGAPKLWNAATLAATQKTTPACSGSTISFTPGAYNKDQTKLMNNLFSGSCSGRTFIFGSGDYWLDVDDATHSPRNSLILNDSTAIIIMGSAKAAPNADQCDPGLPGVSLTLSGRTSIRHLKGRVSICGKAGRASTAIWQGQNANLGSNSTPTGATSPAIDFSNPNGVLAPGGAVSTGQLEPGALGVFCGGRSCDGWKELTVSGIGDSESTPLPGPVNSLQILVSADADDSNGSGALVQLTLTTPAPNPVSCTVQYASLPDGYETVAYELMDATRGDCAGRISDRSQLYGAQVKVRFHLSGDCEFFGLICAGGGPRLDVDYVAARIPWTPRPNPEVVTGSYTSPNGALRANDGNVARRDFSCPISFSSCTSSAYADLIVDNLQDLYEPDLTSAAPDARLTSVGVVIVGDSDRATGGSANTTLTIRGSLIPGSQCFAQFNGLPDEFRPAYYDLLKPSAFNDCATKLTSAAQLVGARLEVTSKLVNDGCEWYFFCGGWGARIDSVGISTTSEVPKPGGGYEAATSYDGPASPFLVTSHADKGSPSDAVWSVSGQVSLPRADLDVRWDGPYNLRETDVPAAGSIGVQPLFAGSGLYALTVNGLGSSVTRAGTGAADDPQVGVLCCSPAKAADRRVILKAYNSTGSLLGQAQVLITDVSVDPGNPGQWRPGQRVSVEKWELFVGA